MFGFRSVTLLVIFVIHYSSAGSCDQKQQLLIEKLIKLLNRFGDSLQKLAEQLSAIEHIFESKCDKALNGYDVCDRFLTRAKSLGSDLESKCSNLHGLGGSRGRGDYGDENGSGANGSGRGNGRGGEKSGFGDGNGSETGEGGSEYNKGAANGSGGRGDYGSNGNDQFGKGYGNGKNSGGGSGIDDMYGMRPKLLLDHGAASGPAYSCPTDWSNNGSYCYRLMSGTDATWDNAESVCARLGAHLVSIHSAAENAFIMNLPGINAVYGSGANSLVANAWIGLKSNGNNHWQWSDGTLFDFQQWGPMYPSWPFENCAQLIYRHLNNGHFGSSILSKWNNFACSMPVQNTICKMKATPPTGVKA